MYRPDYPALRRAMVEEQLRDRGIRDVRVLDAMGRVPREEFVDSDDWRHAYEDMPVLIGYGQTISQPYMVALMVEAASVHEGYRVLDVGSGSGYAAAILRELGAVVHTIERIEYLRDKARTRLDATGYGAVHTYLGDGSRGLPDEAPFDAILVAAAAREVPPDLYDQLVPGGRLVIPIGDRDNQRLSVIVRSPEGPALARSVPCRFVPLVPERSDGTG